MTNIIPLSRALLLLRLSIGLVFIMWTIDKFINPEHAARVFDKFYMIEGLGELSAYIIGGLQLAVVITFILGAFKPTSYLIILIMHLISTASSYMIYFDPWTKTNLLFFAAFPMLAGCWALWALREYDTLLSVDAARKKH